MRTFVTFCLRQRVLLLAVVGALAVAGCLYIMTGLPHQAWVRFCEWLAVGLVLYFFYGFWHSRLRAANKQ